MAQSLRSRAVRAVTRIRPSAVIGTARFERRPERLGHDQHQLDVGPRCREDDQMLEPLQRMAFGVGFEDQDLARSCAVIVRRPGHRGGSRIRLRISGLA